jgi:phosphoserine phosphatase RsbX
MPELGTRLAEWAVRGRPRRDQTISGDDAVTRLTASGIFVAVVDGLGHGPEAAHASRLAVRIAGEHCEASLPTIAEACHRALRKTRGAAMSMAAISAHEPVLTWLGIGNVAGTLAGGIPAVPRERTSLPLHQGILGQHLPRLRPTTTSIHRGNVLVVATDGVDPARAESVPLVGPASSIAERMLAHQTRDDDAHVVVLRYLGADR